MLLEVLTASESLPFVAALLLMILIGAVEAIGLGSSGIDLDVDDGSLLDWLGFGQVPLLIVIVAFLASFGIVGLVAQQAALGLTGALLPSWIAVPSALALAVPATGALARGLSRILPQDETTAFPVERLVGLTGTVTVGRAEQGSPARLRVVDPHGQAHNVLVEPDTPGAVFETGDEVLLVRRTDHHFRGILHDSPRLTDWTVA